MRKIPVIIFLACICFFSISSIAFSQITLKLTGIDGESIIVGHQDEIDVSKWSWEINTPDDSIRVVGGNRASPNTVSKVKPLAIIKYVDKASPHLFLAALDGTVIPDATLYILSERSDVVLVEHLTITMKDVRINDVFSGGEGHTVLAESVTLVFSKVCYEYYYYDDQGDLIGVTKKCWDVENDRETDPF